MSVYINHSTNDVSTNAGAKVTSGGNTVITTTDAATESASGIVELATSAEVQTGTDTGRVPSVSSLRGGLLVSGTAIATTSGTSHDFTGIPSWVKKIKLGFSDVSTNGTSLIQVQIGDSGGIETTGYSCGAFQHLDTPANSTTGFLLVATISAGSAVSGIATLVKIDGNLWAFSSTIGFSSAATAAMSGGSKTLTDVLDRVRLTTVNGTDTFDAGKFNIIYE